MNGVRRLWMSVPPGLALIVALVPLAGARPNARPPYRDIATEALSEPKELLRTWG